MKKYILNEVNAKDLSEELYIKFTGRDNDWDDNIFDKEDEEVVFGLYNEGKVVACAFVTHMEYLKAQLMLAGDPIPEEVEEDNSLFITCLASTEKGAGAKILKMLQDRFAVDIILEAVSTDTEALKEKSYYRIGFEDLIEETDYLIRKI